MEDKQKVYIKGNPSRGTEVIKALTDLGGRNIHSHTGDSKDTYYYINPNGVINVAAPDGKVCYPFLKEFYKEIKLPEIKKWKDGDLLVRPNLGKKEYAIYSDKKAKFDDEIMLYAYANDKIYGTNVICESRDFKAASVSDINDFQNILHTYRKEWSFKHKKLIDWKFKPQNNEEYWYINDLGEICHSLYNYFVVSDNKRERIGNYFQTKLEAINARNKMVKSLGVNCISL